ncbi:MAG: hypothetical protein AAGF53_10120 [Pseudomonadota bacterium]
MKHDLKSPDRQAIKQIGQNRNPSETVTRRSSLSLPRLIVFAAFGR